MTAKQDAVTKLIRKAIDGLNALPTSYFDPAFEPTLSQVHEDLETAIRILDLVQCEVKAQVEKL